MFFHGCKKIVLPIYKYNSIVNYFTQNTNYKYPIFLLLLLFYRAYQIIAILTF